MVLVMELLGDTLENLLHQYKHLSTMCVSLIAKQLVPIDPLPAPR